MYLSYISFFSVKRTDNTLRGEIRISILCNNSILCCFISPVTKNANKTGWHKTKQLKDAAIYVCILYISFVAGRMDDETVDYTLRQASACNNKLSQLYADSLQTMSVK